MTGPILRRLTTLALASWLGWGLTAPSAHAQITGFELSIHEVGGLSLSDRLGKSVGSSEHIVNIEDCERYQGGRARFRARLLSSAPSGAGDAAVWAAAHSTPGGTCRTVNGLPEADQNCIVLEDQADLTSTTVEVDVRLSELIGTDCGAGTESVSRIYFYLVRSGVADQVQVVEVDVDLNPPEAPELTRITPGDRRLKVDWSDEVNDGDDVTYTVYWSKEPFGEDELSGVSRRSGLTATSYSIEGVGLENGVTYYVAVAAVDEADNRSPLSNLDEAAPVPTTDFWEHYQESGGQETGGFCFIATAAYGTPMAGQLGPLRRFRDSVLLTTAPGRAFVDAYYTWGRYAAAFIAERPALRGAVRVALVPAVWLADLATTYGVPATLFALLLAGALFRRARQRALRGPFDPPTLLEVSR